MPRLYDPTAGAVTVDGVDVRDLSLSNLAEVVGLVTQEAYLFADTLRANIAYARPEAAVSTGLSTPTESTSLIPIPTSRPELRSCANSWITS